MPDEVLDQWLKRASKDPPGTLAELLKIMDMDAELHRELLEWILAAWMSDDRQAALDWLERSLESMETGQAAEVIELALAPWGATQPHEAADWVNTHLVDWHRMLGLRIVAGSWADADPAAMGEWIRTRQPNDELWRDELVDSWIRQSPLDTLNWCAADPDKEWAGRTRQMIMRSWLMTAPEDAKAYLMQHPDLVPENPPEEAPPAHH